MPPYQKPRIVLEESPWGEFFQNLPNMLLAFKGEQYKAEEAERTRQHQKDLLYLRNLLDTKSTLQKAALDSANIAREKGAILDFEWKNIFDTTPEKSTQGGAAAVQDLKNIYQNNNDTILNTIDKIDNEAKLANMGAKHAETIDANFDGNIDTKEVEVFQQEHPELLEDLGLTEFPKSYMAGARVYLDDPKVRQAQKDRFAINREIYDRYDALLDKDEDGNPVQLYKSLDIDPNQQGKAELEQALFLLELGADPKIVQTQLSQVETAKPIQYSFGDKTYTQVSSDQVTTEDDGTMTAMMGGEKIKVVGDIAAYPGMKFATDQRYKSTSKGAGVGGKSTIWDKIQEEYDNSTAFYNTQLSSKEDRESYISDEIGAQLMNPGKIKFDKDEMTKEGADKVKKILGHNILLIARWGEDSFWGWPLRNDLEKLLSAGNYEGVVDYFMDPETKVARLRELDLSDSDAPWNSAADKTKAENAMTLFKQHLKDYDMLDRPADWLVDNPRI